MCTSKLDNKIREAMHRIESLYNETGGNCYVSFSGGKDSTVILALIKMCEEIYTIPKDGIPAVFSNTGVELGLTIEYVNWIKDNYYKNLTIIRPEKSFDWVIKNVGKPLRSKFKARELHQWHCGERTESLTGLLATRSDSAGSAKYALSDSDMHFLHDSFQIIPSARCCDYLKKKPLEVWAKDHNISGCFLGIRLAEGGPRELNAIARVNSGGQLCTWIRHGITNKAPIIDWDDTDIFEFINEYKVPLSRAYTEYGFNRTGCIMCPFSPDLEDGLSYLHEHEPARYKAAMHWLKDVYIAQDIKCPYDSQYESERLKMWSDKYSKMRVEMLEKYRPESKLLAHDRTLMFDNKAEEDQCAPTANKLMNVLIIGDRYQTACIKFRQRGHRAFSCDREECGGGHPEWHIWKQCDDIINGSCKFTTQDDNEHEQIGQWDMIIAYPPCSFMAKSGASRLFRKEEKYYRSYGTFQMINAERLRDGIISRDLFMKILHANCPKIAIEGPVILNIFAVPAPSQIIQPYQFGDQYRKQTCLWLKGLPNLAPLKL